MRIVGVKRFFVLEILRAWVNSGVNPWLLYNIIMIVYGRFIMVYLYNAYLYELHAYSDPYRK